MELTKAQLNRVKKAIPFSVAVYDEITEKIYDGKLCGRRLKFPVILTDIGSMRIEISWSVA